MNNKELSNRYLEDTLDLKTDVERKFLELGSRLMKIRDEQLFLATHSSFVEFLWEAKLTESTASKMINIYSHFILALNIDEQLLLDAGGWTTVYKIKDLAKDKESARDWLLKAKDLSPKDLDIVIKEAKSGIPQDECDHELVRFDWCKKCSHKEKVYDEQ